MPQQQPVSARLATAGVAPLELIADVMGPPTATVLFVCDAGTDRAAYLELGLAAELRRRGIQEIEILSAGISAIAGDSMPKPLIDYVGDRGIDARGFSARPLDTAVIDAADLVLAATDAIRARIVELQPRAAARTFTVLDAAYRIPGVAEHIDVTGPAARIRRVATLLDETRDAPRRRSDLRGPRTPAHRMPGRRLVAMDDAVLALAGVARPIVPRRGQHREKRPGLFRRRRQADTATQAGRTRLA